MKEALIICKGLRRRLRKR